MEVFINLFGDNVPTSLKLVILTIVLVTVLLILFWTIRKILGSPVIKPIRGRLPRLAVTDAANLDDKRRLVLIRRDNVEHLVMIGGQTDVLIESNITANDKEQDTSHANDALENQSAPSAQNSEDDESIQASRESQLILEKRAATVANLAAAATFAPTIVEPQAPPPPKGPFDDILKNAKLEVEQSSDGSSSDELNPAALSTLENALGAELAQSNIGLPEAEIANPATLAVPAAPDLSPVVQTPVPPALAPPVPEPVRATDVEATQTSSAEGRLQPVHQTEIAHVPVETVSSEDQMQKLLDELTGEKT